MNNQQLIHQHYDQFIDEISAYHSLYGDHSISEYLKKFRPRITSQINQQLQLIETRDIRDGNLLSLGGWPGITPIILHRITGIKITMIDHPALLGSMVDFYNEHRMDSIAYDFSQAENSPLHLQGSFDLIECCQCIEHWNFSPVPMFKQIFGQLLASDGHLFLTVPNAVSLYRRLSVLFGQTPYPGIQSFLDVDAKKPGADVSPHWREYMQKDLQILVQYCGGKCIEKHTVSYPIATQTFWHHWLYRPFSNIHPALRENIEMTCQSKTADSSIHETTK